MTTTAFSWNDDLVAAAQAATQRQLEHIERAAQERRSHAETLSDLSLSQAGRLHLSMLEKSRDLGQSMHTVANRQFNVLSANPMSWWTDYQAYLHDAAQRVTLTIDAMRQRGNMSGSHEDAGIAPVLGFEYEVVIKGETLERPVNYTLLRILPLAGQPTRQDRAPMLIIDPRAGHGAGIGGFKPESQVGEGLADGHPVYFAAFSPEPVPGQTLADVRDAEVVFLAEIRALHAQAPKPILIGNCQGGWASMIVAATAPELVGPIIINGAPMSYWAGKRGANPMRYLGGIAGGALPAVMMADMGDGVFDGAALVSNFEHLNPANSLFSKYYHLYSNIDTEVPRFLEFERWWGGFYLMNEEEIRWIVENLFIGNKLARGDAVLGGETIDLRRIESPVIVFASHGDNITPPQQALYWIIDTYGSLDLLKVMGKRIVYMLHESIGHLGIFVSSKVAGHEHHAMTETMRAIEALGPGLYEMKLDEGADRVHIRFEHRTFDDILQLGEGRGDEALFETVAGLSQENLELYERTMRPLIKVSTTPQTAEWMRHSQPLRLQRSLVSDRNPVMQAVKGLADNVRDVRVPVSTDNLFMAMERAGARVVETTLDLYREWRDALMETAFFYTYTSPLVKAAFRRTEQSTAERQSVDVLQMPEVQAALAQINEGGLAAGAIRMMLMMNRARGYIRRSRLEKAFEIIKRVEPFQSMAPDEVACLVRCQTLIADLEPELALASLPQVLRTAEERHKALDLVMQVAGPRETMSLPALMQYMRYEALLAGMVPAVGSQAPG
ncbi:MAG: DUF3141 domain-containing protein [Alcaligenaceae bacterium]|nr:DUF3141 domain-containing protein [Alcaligenaceae bacterium]